MASCWLVVSPTVPGIDKGTAHSAHPPCKAVSALSGEKVDTGCVPPGRARLATRPSQTGSFSCRKKDCLADDSLPQCFCFLRLELGNAVCRLPPAKGTALGRDGGFLINVGMRLILCGIAALIAGFAFGLALPSEGRHEIGSADAELRAESPRLSVFGTIHPKRFDLPAPLGSQISDGSRVRVASLGTDVAFTSAVEETDRRSDPPGSMRQRMSFDERFSWTGVCPSTSVFPSTSLRIPSTSALRPRRARLPALPP